MAKASSDYLERSVPKMPIDGPHDRHDRAGAILQDIPTASNASSVYQERRTSISHGETLRLVANCSGKPHRTEKGMSGIPQSTIGQEITLLAPRFVTPFRASTFKEATGEPIIQVQEG
jgi:hypothetical protein